jgi:hypothetical protein
MTMTNTPDERRKKIGDLLRITNPSQVQGDYIVPLPTHSWTDAEKEALRQVLEEQKARIGELESLVAATEEMREDWQDEARKWQRKGRELEQQLAAPRWEPVNPIGMVNDEYADCDIKLCYRLVQPTQAQEGE